METIFDAKKLKSDMEGKDPEKYDGQWVRSVYLGTITNLYPSGKVTAPFADHRTSKEQKKDEAFHNRLERELGKLGYGLETGESDGNDLYAVETVDRPLEDYSKEEIEQAIASYPSGPLEAFPVVVVVSGGLVQDVLKKQIASKSKEAPAVLVLDFDTDAEIPVSVQYW